MAIGGNAMNVAPRLNYHSLRSQKARFSVRFGKAWHLLTGVLSCGLLLLGVWSLFTHGAAGWLLIGLSGPLIMLAIWWEKDLKTAEISKNPQTIDDVMAADVLGKLSPQPTPKDVALAAAGTRAGLFLVVCILCKTYQGECQKFCRSWRLYGRWIYRIMEFEEDEK